MTNSNCASWTEALAVFSLMTADFNLILHSAYGIEKHWKLSMRRTLRIIWDFSFPNSVPQKTSFGKK